MAKKEALNPFNKFRRLEYSKMVADLAEANNVRLDTPFAWFKRMSFNKLKMRQNVEIMKLHGVDIVQEIEDYENSKLKAKK